MFGRYLKCRDLLAGKALRSTVFLLPALLTVGTGCLGGRISLGNDDDAGRRTSDTHTTTTPGTSGSGITPPPPAPSTTGSTPPAIGSVPSPTPLPTDPVEPVTSPDAGVVAPDASVVAPDSSVPDTGPSIADDRWAPEASADGSEGGSYQDRDAFGVAPDEISSRFCAGSTFGVAYGSVNGEVVNRISAVAYSPDGRKIAFGLNTNPPSSPNGLVVPSNYGDLLNVETRPNTLKLEGQTDTVRTIEFSPNGQLLAVAAQKRTGEGSATRLDGVCQIFRASDGTVAYTLTAPAGSLAASCRFSPNGQLLLMSSYLPDHQQNSWAIRIVQASNGGDVRTIGPESLVADQPFLGGVNVDAEFSPDSANVLAHSWRGAGSVRIADGQQLMALSDWNIVRARYSPDGVQIASIGAYGSFRIWNANDGEAVQTFALDTPQRFQVHGLYWVDSDHIVLVADTVRAWQRVPSGEFALACAPSGRLDDLLMGGRDPDAVSQGALSPDGQQLTVPLLSLAHNGLAGGQLWVHPSPGPNTARDN